MKLSNSNYDFLRWVAQIFLPAFTTFLGLVLKCLNNPYTDIIITILVGFDTFLGTILGISTHYYNKEVNDHE